MDHDCVRMVGVRGCMVVRIDGRRWIESIPLQVEETEGKRTQGLAKAKQERNKV